MPAELVMNSTTNNDPQAIPIAIDNDSRNLAIIYGSLGTLIAFASLVFAVLSWLRSRHHKAAAQDQSSVDVELGPNTPRSIDQPPRESPTSSNSHHEYVNNNGDR